MKRIVAIGSAALLALSATQAVAQAAPTSKTAVSYADLDLSHARGRAALERRVHTAIGRVCPDRPHPSELLKMRAQRACRDNAWTGAQAQLAAIYGGRQLAEARVQVSGNAN